MRLLGQDVVCVGFADWDAEVWTNQHHLMWRLAQLGNRVLFIESLGLRRPQMATRDLHRIGRRLRKAWRPLAWHDGVHILSPLVVPLHSNPAVRALNGRLLPAAVAGATRRLDFERPILWSYVPQAEALLSVVEPKAIVYHCVDDIAAQTGVDQSSFRAAEARFARRADLVVASAPALATRMRRLSDHVLFAPNVADTDLFATALGPGPVDAAIEALPRPRLVFVGAVTDTKLDISLIIDVARARPQWSIALVGPVGLGNPGTDVSALHALRNVHLLGVRAHGELVQVLRGADVGLIPYSHNRLTASIFPMKVYEYLAAGLPIVATSLPALAGVSGVLTADGARDTIDAIERSLADDTSVRRRERSSAALGHSWAMRIDEISAALP